MRTFVSKLHQFLDRQQPTRASAGFIYNWYRVNAAITYLILKWPGLISLDILKLIFFLHMQLKKFHLIKSYFSKFWLWENVINTDMSLESSAQSIMLLSRLTKSGCHLISVIKFVNKKNNLKELTALMSHKTFRGNLSVIIKDKCIKEMQMR